MLMEPQQHWHKAENYHTVELMLEGQRMVLKDWWDPGHDPNRSEATMAEFLDGELHEEILQHFSQSVLDEAIETVSTLMVGGPGVAEPPD